MTQRPTFAAAAFFCAIALWSRSSAQTADEFKAAAGKKGCASIPYADINDTCRRQQAEADRFCKNETWSCAGLGTKSLRGQIGALDATIKNQQNERDDIQRQESGAGEDRARNMELKVADLDGVVSTNATELAAYQDTLEKDLDELDRRIAMGRQCRDAITEVRNAFKYATRNARIDTDEQKKPSVDALIEIWSKAREDQDKALKWALEGLEQCEQSRVGEL
jgi:uncharacterized membrane protein